MVADYGRKLSRMLSSTEKARKEISAPVLDLASKINEAAREFTEPVLAERNRLSDLATRFTLTEQRRVAEAEAARKVEIDRLEEERKVALALLPGPDQIQTEQQLNDAIAAEQLAKEAQKNADIAICAPLPKVIRGTGTVTGRKMKYEILDIGEVWKARPDLCRLEINAGAVRAMVFPGMVIPGMRIWEETKTSFRS
jgi:hypothetical protein